MEETLENVLVLCSLLTVSRQNTAQGHQHLIRQTERDPDIKGILHSQADASLKTKNFSMVQWTAKT